MNANPEQSVDARHSPDSSTAQGANGATQTPSARSKEAAIPKTGGYNEEWNAFLADNSQRKKSRTGLSHGESEALPRVWNAPHG